MLEYKNLDMNIETRGNKILDLWVKPHPENGEYPNTGRQFVFDLIKGLCILFLPFCHMTEEFIQMETFVTPTVTFSPGGIIYGILEFIWGVTGAPVFMFCLGVGIVFSLRSSFKYLSIRSLKTIILALLLIFLEQSLSLFIKSNLMNDPELFREAVGWLFCCDILNFAGLTFLFFAFVIRFKLPNLVVLIIPLVLLITSMVVPANLCSDNLILQDLIGWFFWQDGGFSFFPFCQWLIFPVVGYLFSQYLRNTTNKKKFYGRIIPVAFGIFAVFTAVLLFARIDIVKFFTTYEGEFYNQDILSVLWITTFILGIISVFFFISECIHEGTKLHRFFTYMSKSLLPLYFIQWIIIGFTYHWILPGLGILPLNNAWFILAAILVYIALFSITLTYQKIKKNIIAKRTATP